jgi:MraZ protein
MKGEFRHSLDAKGRLFIPAKLREDLGARFTVTRGLDQCLALYPETEWAVLETRIRALPMSKARDLQRFFFSSAFDAEPDSQGRILIPAGLRKYAGLVKETVIVGVAGHAEIWDATRWQAYNDAITEERIIEAMEELGF